MPRNNQIDILRASADIIEEVDGLVTYMGYCAPGTLATSEPKFSIMKIVQSGTTYPTLYTFTWANGSCAQNLVWDNRAGYSYQFKNF
jgi:hypothetical protein